MKKEKPPKTPDPTPEEIWGTETTMGLAEQIRLERPDRTYFDHPTPRLTVYMLPFGIGKKKSE